MANEDAYNEVNV